MDGHKKVAYTVCAVSALLIFIYGDKGVVRLQLSMAALAALIVVFFIVESDESLWARFVGAIFKALKIFLIILLAVAIKKWAISSSGGSGVDYDCQPAIGGQMICQPKY